MPEISSIVRETEVEDGDGETIVSQLGRLADLDLAHQPNEKMFWHRLAPNIFSIFALVAQFNIPAHDLSHVPANQNNALTAEARRTYSLGSGVSCTVGLYKTDEETSETCAAGTSCSVISSTLHYLLTGYPTQGTLVALKQYTTTESDASTSGQKLHRWLLQELKVFCHPYLQTHENICKLQFVAWEPTSVLPTLGLELASYGAATLRCVIDGVFADKILGTLEDCLQQIRSYSPAVRKANLSLDIALGLDALHSVGVVHGDIKPGNIIVCSHPTRMVVAKISDLNSVAPAATYGDTLFGVGTPNWQSPEVLLKENEIDWQLADVYSFGMVLATIWSSTGWIPLGGSFLHPHFPFQLSANEQRVLIELYKTSPDNHPRSMLNIACESTVVDSTCPLPVGEILASCLSTTARNRSPISQILRAHFLQFAHNVGRGDLSQMLQGPSFDASYWGDSSITTVPVGNSLRLHDLPELLTKCAGFKKNMFKELLEAGKKLRTSIPSWRIQDIDDNFHVSDDSLIEYLNRQDSAAMAMVWRDERLQHLQLIALSISLSYFLGLGVTVDEKAAIEWLQVAAVAHEGNAQLWYCPLEQSVGDRPEVSVPRKTWSTAATLSGFRSNSDYLQEFYPSLHELTTTTVGKRYWGELGPQFIPIDPYIDRIMAPIREDIALVNNTVEAPNGSRTVGESALHTSAGIGDMELVKYLVLEAKANINIINNRNETPIFYATRAGHYEIAKFLYDQGAVVNHISTENMAITHCLSQMDDLEAAMLAPLFIDRGASLNQCAEEYPAERQDNFVLGAGIPLAWAALKGKPRLMMALAEMHERVPQKLGHADYYVLLQAFATLHLEAMITTVVQKFEGIVDTTLDNPDTVNIRMIQQRFRTLGLGDLKNELPRVSEFQSLGAREYSHILLLALDVQRKVLLDRRYIHRHNFRSAKEKTIKYLLNLGADPVVQISDGPDSSALSHAVYTCDIIAFRLFIRHLASKDVDVLSILSDKGRYGSCSALVRAIHRDARDIFLFLMDEYPELLNIAGAGGRGPLHAAAAEKWPGYIEKLLEHGGNPHDRAEDRSTPFTTALMRNPDTEIAKQITKMIAKKADMNILLGPDQVTGFTAFAKLLSGLTYYKMDFGIDRLEYLVEEWGKPSFLINARHRTTAFQSLLGQVPPLTDQKSIALERAVLRFLLKIFPEEIDSIDNTGRAPLHMAAMIGNLSAVEVLLQHGANVNRETGCLGPKAVYRGHTALGLVMLMREEVGVPDRIRRGGQREIYAYEQNMTKIIEALAANGGLNAGSGAKSLLNVQIGIALGTIPDFVHVSRDRPRISDETWGGEWPWRLPWEGEGDSPFIQDGTEATIEYIAETGLSKTISKKSLLYQQVLLGAIDKHTRSANYVKPRPLPPAGFMEEVQGSLLNMKEQRRVELQ